MKGFAVAVRTSDIEVGIVGLHVEECLGMSNSVKDLAGFGGGKSGGGSSSMKGIVCPLAAFLGAGSICVGFLRKFLGSVEGALVPAPSTEDENQGRTLGREVVGSVSVIVLLLTMAGGGCLIRGVVVSEGESKRHVTFPNLGVARLDVASM